MNQHTVFAVLEHRTLRYSNVRTQLVGLFENEQLAKEAADLWHKRLRGELATTVKGDGDYLMKCDVTFSEMPIHTTIPQELLKTAYRMVPRYEVILYQQKAAEGGDEKWKSEVFGSQSDAETWKDEQIRLSNELLINGKHREELYWLSNTKIRKFEVPEFYAP